ncbi:glycoside hydrolase family 3 protein [Aaosphaeria arxii CBS 175.79]|uniref:beta-glucosidase n=1 Tax=Aaosphaeria arxii CBS 175.79 TaxID=1450172 RepID=A0A6A5XNK8_9PLEO|nr:glycoside hydrolase family 3 protein [Aaosphaeria arxii CBS 175.79]KAF2014320.1 glycoside hydrolase family 3 protein [Aaosphaeria arxii CBS 175.79]
MDSQDYLDVDALINDLSLSEKIALLSGAGACSTVPNERLKIPVLETSDGPHGLRGGGGRFYNMPPGYQFPSATALGATFDTELMYAAGQLIGQEGRRKGVGVALAPTVCLQRSPLLGRGFEAFGEDPILSGTMAAHYVRGVQDCKVAVSLKHYVAHDQSAKALEDETFMSQRTLRELHLLPFQIVQHQAKPWSYMAAYQRINGIHVSEDPFLLKKILREEWGFDGLVMSDWWGTYSTAEALNAGLDLEMPGPSIWRGKQLATAVDARKVRVKTIDRAVRNLLNLINKTLHPPRQDGDGEDTPSSRTTIRRMATDSIVLLKNTRQTLPLCAADADTSFGFIGELFEYPAHAGGGSSESTPFYVSSPLDAISEVLGAGRVRYQPGCYTRRWTPNIRSDLFLPGTEKPGLFLEWFGEDPQDFPTTPTLHTNTTTNTTMYFSQLKIDNVPDTYYIRITTDYISPQTGTYRLALSTCGKAKLLVNDNLAVDQWSRQPHKTDDTACFNKLTTEEIYDIDVQKGVKYKMCILMTNRPLQPIAGTPGAGGVRLGGQFLRNEDQAIVDAVELAREVSIPVVVVGLGSDYEYEASDRTHLRLSRRQDEMVRRVCEANSRTVVVVQTGMPIEMPWIDKAASVLHCWLGGQETGHALADILFGKTNPSGRLSVTFPRRLEDNPAFLNFGKSEHSIYYGEGVFLGYRYYEKLNVPPLFYFGHGLSYTTFDYNNVVVPEVFQGGAEGTLTISVDVTNTGSVDGAETVQVYVSDCESSVQRPRKELKGFTKVFLRKGDTRTCRVTLDKYAVSFWSEKIDQWVAEAGEFNFIIARSSNPADELVQKRFNLPETFTWSGL